MLYTNIHIKTIDIKNIRKKLQEIEAVEILEKELPTWLDNCPLVSGWCRYNGHIYYADLNYEESEKANKPIFDLAFCATKAMNGIYLLRREWDAKKFRRWSKISNW